MEELKIGNWRNKINIGYIRELKLIAIDNIVRFDEPLIFDNCHKFDFSRLQISENAKVYQINFFKRECTFSTKSAKDTNGFIYDISIGWTWTGNDQSIIDFLFKNQCKKWIALFTDYNSNSYLIGSIELPAKLLFLQNIDSQNTIKAQLISRNWHPAWFIDNINFLNMATVIDLTRYTVRNIKVMRGDSLYETFTFANEDGSLQIITDDTFLMHVKNNTGTLILAFERKEYVPGNIPVDVGDIGTGWIENGFTVNEIGDTLIMSKTYSEMAVESGTYNYDLVRITPDGKREVQIRGKFIIEENVTSIIEPNV